MESHDEMMRRDNKVRTIGALVICSIFTASVGYIYYNAKHSAVTREHIKQINNPTVMRDSPPTP